MCLHALWLIKTQPFNYYSVRFCLLSIKRFFRVKMWCLMNVLSKLIPRQQQILMMSRVNKVVSLIIEAMIDPKNILPTQHKV